MALNWCSGIVTKKVIWTKGLFTLHVHVPGVEAYEPGQFLRLGALSADDEIIHRPYSVASPWQETLEFFIVLVPDGKLTPTLWNCQEGDSIEVSQRAAGSFTLQKTPDAPHLWLIATGTGLAPYIAMLRTEAPWQRYEKIVLVHGARQHADLAYSDELLSLQAEKPARFCYLPALTREKIPEISAGRITELLANGQLEERSGLELSPENSAVMLCGNPAMLDEMEKRLESRGLKKHRSKSPGQIVLERYW